MKKIKGLLSLLALSAVLFTACNNGNYNADPATDLSDIPNPFEYGGATVGGPGYIRAFLNEDEVVFKPANWMDDASLGRAVSGIRRNSNGTMKDEFSVMFHSFPTGGDSVFNIGITYSIFLNDTTISEVYTNDFAGLEANAFVTGFDWYKLTGKFSGILQQAYPGNPNKKVVVSQGYFDTGKQ